MGWKTINGRQYYYRSVRENGKVRTQYVGGGDLAELIAALDESDREDARSRREGERDQCRAFDEVEEVLVTLHHDSQRLAAEMLRAAGYRLHARSQWRKKRGD